MRKLIRKIMNDPINSEYTKNGNKPLFSFSQQSKIIIIGQAPGIYAQTSGIPWDDKSGKTLREWLEITHKEFYDKKITALIPMDFYYPGKGKTGDLPPRKGFAEKWHPPLLETIKGKPLIILIGQYAQKFYLKDRAEKNLTETVRNYKNYIEDGYFPLPHPSPRNNIWMKKNPWFRDDVIPALQVYIKEILSD